VDQEAIGEEAQLLQPGQLLQVGRKDGLELALVDGAALRAAPQVGEEVIGVDEVRCVPWGRRVLCRRLRRGRKQQARAKRAKEHGQA